MSCPFQQGAADAAPADGGTHADSGFTGFMDFFALTIVMDGWMGPVGCFALPVLVYARHRRGILELRKIAMQ
ncbi:hypothetical protein CBP34_06740 [Acidovorax carolinensis]|uniref:Uncharacterized protein n=1 Tax=Acidovorax carolinensis TaxID=553814 RepID=A0A240U1W9_9BURK|nr:hypothetical protein CBP34_06740 [Acidovorax carolinensis]